MAEQHYHVPMLRYAGRPLEVAVVIRPDSTNAPGHSTSGGIASVTRTGVGLYRVTMQERHFRLRELRVTPHVEHATDSYRASCVLGTRTQAATGNYIYDIQLMKEGAAVFAANDPTYAAKVDISCVWVFEQDDPKDPITSFVPVT
jgi:hypothetical protein